MASQTTETIVGGVVLAAAAGFLWYIGQSTAAMTSGGSYPLNASFRSAEGLRIGTDVRMAGVRVGSVTGLELDPETYRAETTFTVVEGIELPDDTTAIIASEGLLGGVFLELQPGGSPFSVEPGGTIEDTQSSVSLIQLLMQFVSGGDE